MSCDTRATTATFPTYTRKEHTRDVEVPIGAQSHEISEILTSIRDGLDTSDYTDDYEYWKDHDPHWTEVEEDG